MLYYVLVLLVLYIVFKICKSCYNAIQFRTFRIYSGNLNLQRENSTEHLYHIVAIDRLSFANKTAACDAFDESNFLLSFYTIDASEPQNIIIALKIDIAKLISSPKKVARLMFPRQPNSLGID